MTLSVVIPAYNEEQYIARCLASLETYFEKKFEHLKLLEIIVVDNASTDKTASLAKKFPHVKVVTEKNKGITYARQKGLSEAKGELLAYIDADTYVTKQWFETIEKEFLADPELLCLSGPYIYYDIPRWQRGCVRFYWNYLAMFFDVIIGYIVFGGNFIAKKKTLEEIGGFDTSIKFYGEDTNIGRRIHDKGKVKYSNSFAIYTSGRRLNSEGILKVGMKYGLNFLTEAFLHKPALKKYTDFR